MELAWFSILLLLAEIAGTVGGFGSSMLVMPLAGEFLPFEQALGLTAVFHVFSNGAKMILFRKGPVAGAPLVPGCSGRAWRADRCTAHALPQ